MKVNDKTMADARRVFCRNPFWRKIYDEAPERAKYRLNLSFWYSEYGKSLSDDDREAYRRERSRVERELTYEDASYLATHDSNENAKKHFAELCEQIQMRPLMTTERLDEAIDWMTADAPQADRDAYAKTRELLKAAGEDAVPYSWLWKAVGGDGEECLMIGDIFDHGHGVAEDAGLARFWFEKGARCGNGECCYRLALIYEDGSGSEFNQEAARFWFREGLRRRNPLVMAELGHRLTLGEGIWKELRNPVAGVQLLKSSLKNDEYSIGHYYLAQCHELGVGVPVDVPEAIRLYRLAADRGSERAEEACHRLGERNR